VREKKSGVREGNASLRYIYKKKEEASDAEADREAEDEGEVGLLSRGDDARDISNAELGHEGGREHRRGERGCKRLRVCVQGKVR
jgi:hypothetical protein